MKLIKNKKAFNDVSIITVVLAVFFLSAILITYLSPIIGGSTQYNTQDITQDIRQESENASAFSIFTLWFTLLKIMFWDFGNTLGLPILIDIMFKIFTIMLAITVSRVVTHGGA